jgi:anhydro-N-acetylmuramic acid kinase
MIVAGVMSGTSADGVMMWRSAASRLRVGKVVRRFGRSSCLVMRALLIRRAVRAAVLRAMNAESISVAEMSRLNWRLGEVYADAVEKTAVKFGVKLASWSRVMGRRSITRACAKYLWGSRVRATWQTGEASVIAERLRVPVVSDFRAADMAAGGQAAPLVPMLDYTMFRDAKKSRVLLEPWGNCESNGDSRRLRSGR